MIKYFYRPLLSIEFFMFTGNNNVNIYKGDKIIKG